MDTKTKIFWWTMGVMILISGGLSFYRYIIKKDYMIQAQVDCDPYTEACFVWECDPESEEDSEKCTGYPEKDIWYYKIINKNASQIVSCDANDEDCNVLVCAQNELDCEFVFCNLDNMEERGSSVCIDPIKYVQENPIEEECKDESEECLNLEEGKETNNEVMENNDEIVSEEVINDIEKESQDVKIDDDKAESDTGVGSKNEQGLDSDNETLSQEGAVSEKNKDASGSLPVVE